MPSNLAANAKGQTSGIYRITPELVTQSPTYPRYFGTDADKYAERSSLEGLLATPVPLWVGTAELDPPPFREQGELLRDSLRKAGKSFRFVEFAAHSHMSEAYSIHSDDRSVGDALLGFVRGNSTKRGDGQVAYYRRDSSF